MVSNVELVIDLTSSAYIFVNLSPEVGDESLEDIRNSKLVREISLILEPFDLVIKVEGENKKEIDAFVSTLKEMKGFEEILLSPTLRTLKRKAGTKRINIEGLSLEERLTSFNEAL